MSRIFKIYLRDNDFEKIYGEHGDVTRYIYSLLGLDYDQCTMEEYITHKVKSIQVGKIFTFRDIFEPKDRTIQNARLLRYICKRSDFVELTGYSQPGRIRLYKRIEGEHNE